MLMVVWEDASNLALTMLFHSLIVVVHGAPSRVFREWWSGHGCVYMGVVCRMPSGVSKVFYRGFF